MIHLSLAKTQEILYNEGEPTTNEYSYLWRLLLLPCFHVLAVGIAGPWPSRRPFQVAKGIAPWKTSRWEAIKRWLPTDAKTDLLSFLFPNHWRLVTFRGRFSALSWFQRKNQMFSINLHFTSLFHYQTVSTISGLSWGDSRWPARKGFTSPRCIPF